VLLVLGISAGIPLTMIIIGGIFVNDCPIQKVIPLWLISKRDN